MPTPVWNRAEGGIIDTDSRYKLAGPVVAPGFRVMRAKFTMRAGNNIGANNAAAPTAIGKLYVGLRFGIDASTVPAADPVTGINTIDWLGIYQSRYDIVPRSTVNGWDLVVGPFSTVDFDCPRTVPSPSRQMWLISSVLPVPSGVAWTGSGLLEVLGYTP